jgi:hypothetical protein
MGSRLSLARLPSRSATRNRAEVYAIPIALQEEGTLSACKTTLLDLLGYPLTATTRPA